MNGRAPKTRPADPDDVAAAEEVALRILAGAAQTELSLRQRLQQRGFSATAARAVAVLMSRRGYVDDDAFAQAVAERRLRRGHSRALVAVELRARGVGERPIADALENVSADDELASAVHLAQTLARRSAGRHPDPRRRLSSIVAAMRRRGFDMTTIRTALRQGDLGAPGSEIP